MIWVFIFLAAIYVIIKIQEEGTKKDPGTDREETISDPSRLLTGGSLNQTESIVSPSERMEQRIVTPISKDIVRGPWPSLRAKVIQRDGGKCTNCGTQLSLQAHHIIPLSLGGKNVMENLTTLCKDCHQNRHNRTFSDNVERDDLRSYGFNYKVKDSKISIINSSLRSGDDLVIDYLDKNNQSTNRRITPKGIVCESGQYYLSSYCHLRNEGRTFRISRITKVVNV
ncbi:MAG: HNH endonuclease [Candidatus Berkelbacteria bacterium]|nr:HNH endonuclease [Candidatus Berkelbacteria bacterium]